MQNIGSWLPLSKSGLESDCLFYCILTFSLVIPKGQTCRFLSSSMACFHQKLEQKAYLKNSFDHFLFDHSKW